jgi:hypothetical protein
LVSRNIFFVIVNAHGLWRSPYRTKILVSLSKLLLLFVRRMIVLAGRHLIRTINKINNAVVEDEPLRRCSYRRKSLREKLLKA